jgi:ADP-ribosylglycohydrolase
MSAFDTDAANRFNAAEPKWKGKAMGKQAGKIHPEPADYAARVYAGVLGKVIGVYLGAPFEGWTDDRIQRELGEINGFVQERLGRLIGMPDDDISGTLTFLRALSDHDAWGQVTSGQIGQTWLNYLIEGETVLWWGGLGHSTEHAAWLRLASGIPAPRSGSIEMNGQVVAEQIGAQIFIDGWAMVAPGNPELAAALADRAGRVSHDGVAVDAAKAVAVMESLAFVERDMDKLFDAALSFMPAKSILHRIYGDVRGWAAAHGQDWRRTFARIKERYGYDKFGGGCHMVPNHALMVMAWAHAPRDFAAAIRLAAMAGWDTDCNCANVGCLMGIKEGIDGILVEAAPGRDAPRVDWQAAFADRALIPTAEGTHGITDCLREADGVVVMGRRVMGWPEQPAPKNGARFHFSQPGARHGFASDDLSRATVRNAPSRAGSRCLSICVLSPETANVATQTYLPPATLAYPRLSYNTCVAPTLYSGQVMKAVVTADAANARPVRVRLFVRHYTDMTRELPRALVAGDAVELAPGATVQLDWTVPATGGWPIFHAGIEVAGGPASVDLEWLDWRGSPRVRFPAALQHPGAAYNAGWIVACRTPVCKRDTCTELLSNRGQGLLITGTTDWVDYAFSCRMQVRLAEAAGLVARHGGLLRHLALVFDRRCGELQLVRRFDDAREILAAAPCAWKLNEWHLLCIEVRGQQVRGLADGVCVLEATFDRLPAGGVALLSDTGSAEFADVAVEPLT